MMFAVAMAVIGGFIGIMVHTELRDNGASRSAIRAMDIAMAVAVGIPVLVMLTFGG